MELGPRDVVPVESCAVLASASVIVVMPARATSWQKTRERKEKAEFLSRDSGLIGDKNKIKINHDDAHKHVPLAALSLSGPWGACGDG
jgi:hypothetical protein